MGRYSCPLTLPLRIRTGVGVPWPPAVIMLMVLETIILFVLIIGQVFAITVDWLLINGQRQLCRAAYHGTHAFMTAVTEDKLSTEVYP